MRGIEERHRDALLTALFEEAPVPIALIDPETHRFTRVNYAGTRFWEYSETELINMRWEDITRSRDVDPDREEMAKLLTGNIRTYTMYKEYVTKSGRVVGAELTMRPVKCGGKIEFLVSHVTPSQISMIISKIDELKTETHDASTVHWLNRNWKWFVPLAALVWTMLTGLLTTAWWFSVNIVKGVEIAQ